jgi:probable F420-dependent oxidoreductase
MKIDRVLDLSDISSSAAQAAEAEAAGYDGVFTAEGQHDPFYPLVLAATSTTKVDLGTAVAIAFARSPMTVANTGYDLQLLSKGRFTLGLGSQIRPHITRRFGMPWSQPAKRMREYVLALRAVWACWQDGVPLDFRGEFYSHTLMTFMFSPPPNPYGNPKVWLAGVGDAMVEAAGEVADGLVCHPLISPLYLNEAVKPALARGVARRDADGKAFELAGMVMLGLHDDDAASLQAALTGVKRQIAFYGSTPAYRPVLEAHGWGSAQDELNRLSKQGAWAEMGDLVTDEMAHAFAVIGRPGEVASELARRFGDDFERVTVSTPFHRPTGLLDEFRRTMQTTNGPIGA